MSTPTQIPASPVSPLIVQLFYERPPLLDMEQLTARVQAYCGRVSQDSKSLPAPGSNRAHYFMLDALATFAQGQLPSQLCVCFGEKPPSMEELAPSLQQTWDWPEAAQVVSQCSHFLIANDLMAATADRKVRNRQFRGFLRALQELAPCSAMHWMNTQMFVNPARFLYQQGEAALAAQLYGSINARFYNIEGSGSDMLMDTLGLGVLGLPDLQCHFRELPPGEVARVLFNTALYLFEQGDIIKDGQTIPGVLPDDRWVCQHENSLVPPQRIILDMNPGGRHAAGNRNV